LLDNFDDRYLGAKSSDPALDNDGNALVLGALYFNTTDGVMKVYTASGWIAASSASVATLATFEFVATAGQTVFTGNDANGSSLSYVAPAIIVTLNGVRLRPGDDYTATNGTSITLVSAAALNDELVVDAFGSFLVANTVDLSTAQTVGGVKTFSANTVFNGNVGIGTASPGARLQIGDGTLSTSNALIFGKYSTASETNLPSIRQGSADGFGNDLIIGSTSTSGTLRFYTGAASNSLDFGSSSNAERMRVDNSGRITMPFQPSFGGAINQASNLTSGQIPFGDIIYLNIGSCWNASTHRFTAPIAGNYLIVASARHQGAASLIYNFRKNGTQIYQANSSGTGSSYGMINLVYPLSAGDYIDFPIVSGGLGAGADTGTLAIRLV